MKRSVSLKALLITLAALLTVFGLSFISMNAAAADVLQWPVPGHTRLSQGYHDGKAIDISDGSIAGARVVAAHSGTVTAIWTCGQQHCGSMHSCNGFGTGLVIKGTDGRFYQYAHMQSGSIPSNVYNGAYVSAGQTIGAVGTTGNSSGNHLHFGISMGTWWNNSGINPQNENYSTQVSLSYSSFSVTSVTTTNACLSATISNPGYARFSSVGAYIWNASGTLIKNYSESCTLNYSSFNQGLNINTEAGLTLNPGSTYYVQFYGTANGQTFYSSKISFTTTQAAKAANISYGTARSIFIRKNNAKLYISISNPGRAKITKVGVQVWNKNGKLIKNYTEKCNRTLASFCQYIDLNKEARLTLSKNSKYYIRFYAVTSQKTFYSKIYYFYTAKK